MNPRTLLWVPVLAVLVAALPARAEEPAPAPAPEAAAVAPAADAPAPAAEAPEGCPCKKACAMKEGGACPMKEGGACPMAKDGAPCCKGCPLTEAECKGGACPLKEGGCHKGCWRSEVLPYFEKSPARLEAGPFELAVHARLNVWAGWVGKDALLDQGDPMQESGFRLRRTRFGVDGSLFKTITYGIEMDLFDSEKQGGPLYDAWVDWTPSHWFGVTVGFQKFPLVKSEMNSSFGTAHLDRAVGIKAMAPSNTLGLTVHSELWDEHLTLTAGVFNGLQRNASFWDGYEGVGVSMGSKFQRLSYVGRLDIEPMGHVGSGEPDLCGGKARLAIGGGGFYSNGKTDEIYGASGYLHLKAYGFHLLGEAVWDHAKPGKRPTTVTTTPSEIDRLVAQGTIGYVMKKINTGLAVRAEYVNSNLDIADEDDQVIVAVTLSHYVLKHYLKVMAEYQTRIELNGKSLKNDAAIVGIQLGF